MSLHLISFMIMITALMVALFFYRKNAEAASATEAFVQRDVAVDSRTLQRIDEVRDETAPFPTRRPGDEAAPLAPNYGYVLADYSQSLDKPYDDFASPEPHHLERVHPLILDEACGVLGEGECRLSKYCVFVNGSRCRGAFPNTNNARAYNNYESKTLPQSDLSYYYRDGTCHGDCDGWKPHYAEPDPVFSAVGRVERPGISFAGMLTPAEMYNRLTYPQTPAAEPRARTERGPTPGSGSGDKGTTPGVTLAPLPASARLGAVLDGALDTVEDVVRAVGPPYKTTCDFQCAHGWTCQPGTALSPAVCVPQGHVKITGSCDLNCGVNYHCDFIQQRPVCVANAV